MKSLPLNSRKIERLLYFLIWALVFSVPYFNQRSNEVIEWKRVIIEWLHLSGYFAIFLLNVYVLVPKLLLQKKYPKYFGLTFSFIFLIVLINLLVQYGPQPQSPLELRLPTNGLRPEMMPPADGFMSSPPGRGPKSPLMVIVDNFIICILITGAGTATKLVTKSLDEEKLRIDIEKEQLRTNLELLRHQVSPHFFMNTLNNIHSLIEMDTGKAQDAVERLSILMRYLLYDSAQSTIEIKKEIEFIHSFVSLMQLRHSEEVEVKVVVPEQIPDTKIPPMLFISLLENAFKHGVSYPLKSFIYFELQINETSLNCIIKNSKHKMPAKSQGEYSGIGLENINKSLKLLYADDFHLNILDKETEFEVNLKIPI